MSRHRRNNLEYYANIRDEYQTQFINILKGPFYSGLKTIYTNVKEDSKKNNDRNIMKNFQLSLKNIPVWNQDIIDAVSANIMEKSDCDYLDKLLEVVIKSNFKLLSLQKRKKKTELEIPDLKSFIHKCYCEIAREVFVNPFLMCDYDLNTWELQSNLRETYRLIESSITNAIRKYLPFKKMISFYLNEDDKDSIPSDLLSSDLSVSESYDEDDEPINASIDEPYKSDEEELDEVSQELTTALEQDDVIIKDDDEPDIQDEPEPSIEEEAKDEVPEHKEDKEPTTDDFLIGKQETETNHEAEVVVEPVQEKIEKNEDVEEIVIDEPEPTKIQPEEEILIEEVVKEEKPLEKIVDDDKLEAKLNVVPPEPKEKVLEESFDDDNDIKKIKITTTDKKKMIFFEDADSD